MLAAVAEARKAEAKGEVPVGAVLVVNGQVVAGGHNRREQRRDPTAHAEIIAMRRAGRVLGSWRLIDATLYVTLEPCVMCIGAAVNARVARLVYGPRDPKAGAVDSLYDIARDPRLNHRLAVTSGVLEESLRQMLSGFFADLRSKRRTARPEGANTLPGGGVAGVSESAPTPLEHAASIAPRGDAGEE